MESRIMLFFKGYTVSQIWQQLREERTTVSCQALHNLLQKFHEKGMIENIATRSMIDDTYHAKMFLSGKVCDEYLWVL